MAVAGAPGFGLVVDGVPVEPSLLARLTGRLVDDLRSIAKGPGPGLGVLAPAGNTLSFVAAERACHALGLTLVLRAPFADTGRLPLVAEIAEAAAEPVALERTPPPGVRFPEGVAVASFTSGSSGEAKLVLLTAEGQRYQYRTTAERLEISGDDRLCLPLPLNHAYGFSVLGAARHAGAQLWLERSCDVPVLDRRIRDAAVTTLDGVPGVYAALARRLRADGEGAAAFARLRVRGCGGEVLPPAVEDACAALGAPLHNGYGLTEAGPNVALNSPADNVRRSVGRPIPGTEVRTDPATGEVLVAGPGVMLGYFTEDGVVRAGGSTGGWLRTGDLGSVRDGALFIDGRVSERIIVNGETVIPGHLEELLGQRFGAERICVSALAGPAGTVRLGVLVAAPGGFDRDGWVAWSRQLLPPHLRFRRVVVAPALPQLPNGKVDRAAVRAAVGRRHEEEAHA